ncbi:SGNH hydrolase-type esterase domain-containing protein [Clohesyomyces aquaticus]|uniref:SGNH hydrolase-type esterase domain-containing protein n=1 Tax=Clohesyomyces aquaticus TaxID=1231657 RepID=A0A1Y1ZXA3_9PLEO|nr:SGNH hydrolase-type esterase domain-containing protein [Clohesyomyces aquaticus]
MVSFKLLALTTLVAASSAQNTTIRYMPFGDSITEIICWRAKLWEKLQTTEWKSVDWVGSGKTENNCKDTKYDRDNEGHSGFLAIDIANKKQLDGWLAKNPADVITMHLGTNDIVQQSKATADIIKAFTTLVGTMRTSNPKMKIIVAQIIPISIGNYNAKIQDLNKAIIPWAQGLNTTDSPIWVVDQFTGFSASSDLRDGVHPNDAGDTKMMNVWYPALTNALAQVKKQKLAEREVEEAAELVERRFVA